MGGGAIYNSKSNDNGVTTVPDMNVDSATFTGNYVETSATQTGGSTSGDMGSGFATGGAIYNNQAQVTVSNSTFDGNQAISHLIQTTLPLPELAAKRKVGRFIPSTVP